MCVINLPPFFINSFSFYIISSLCHYFESEKSVTSLTLVRDSYGLHASKNSSKSNASTKFSNKTRTRRGGIR